jgi:hypothetical protein
MYSELYFIHVWPENVEIIEKHFVKARRKRKIWILPFCKTLATTAQTFGRILPKSGEKSWKYGRNLIYFYKSDLPCVDFHENHTYSAALRSYLIYWTSQKSERICKQYKSEINFPINHSIIFAVPILMRFTIAQYIFVDISRTKLFRQYLEKCRNMWQLFIYAFTVPTWMKMSCNRQCVPKTPYRISLKSVKTICRWR